MVFSATAPTAPADPNSRLEKSLARLTSRFVELLQRSPTGVLDLQKAAEDLKVPGRRMYDITNVLEGVGLIEKVSKKCIRWKRAVARQDLSEEELNAAAALEKEVETLNDQEKLLDMQLAMKKQSLAYTIVASGRHSYVHFQDLCQGFQESTILTVKAPNNTDMNISESDVYLNAMSGRIEVTMVEKDWDGQILATSIPLENQPDTFQCPEDLRENGVYDTKFTRGEAFGGGYEPRFTHEEAFDGGYDSQFTHEETFGGGYDFNHSRRLNEVSAVDNPGTKRNCEFGVGPPAKRCQPWSCGESMDKVDNNDLVELDVLMKAVQEIQSVDSTEIHAVSNAEEVAASNSFSHINVIQEIQAIDNTENEDVNSFSHIKVTREIAPADNIEKGAVNNSSLVKAVQEIEIHAVVDSEKGAAANSFSYIKVIQDIQAVDNTEFVNSSSLKKAAQEIYVGDNIEKSVQEIHADNILEKSMQESRADDNSEKDKEADIDKSFSLGHLGYGQNIVRAEKEVNGAVDSFGDAVMEDVEAARVVDTRKKTPGTRINPAMPAFKCNKCGKCFPSKTGLYNHRVNVHKIQDIVNLSPLKISAPTKREKIIPTRNIQVKTDALIKNSTYVENNPAHISPDQLFGVHASRAGLTYIEPSFHDGSKVGDDVNSKADDFEFDREPFEQEYTGIFHDEGRMKRSVIVKNVAFSYL